MKALQCLPGGYEVYERVNLQKDKKTALVVNIASVAAYVIMILLGHFAFTPL